MIVVPSALFTIVEPRLRMPSLSRNARFQNKTSGACDMQLEKSAMANSYTVDQGEAFAKLTERYMSRKACRFESFVFRNEPDTDSRLGGGCGTRHAWHRDPDHSITIYWQILDASRSSLT